LPRRFAGQFERPHPASTSRRSTASSAILPFTDPCSPRSNSIQPVEAVEHLDPRHRLLHTLRLEQAAPAGARHGFDPSRHLPAAKVEAFIGFVEEIVSQKPAKLKMASVSKTTRA
jgi:hypothetical protein